MSHPHSHLGLRILWLCAILLFPAVASALPVVQLGPFGPNNGTVDGTAPFNVFNGCANTDDQQTAGEDCGEANLVVRNQDVVAHSWSVVAKNYAGGANLKNVILEQTIKPAAGAVIAFERIPVVCTATGGGGTNPVSNIVNNADGSSTLICNLGEFTEGQQKSFSVYVKVSGKSTNGSSYTSEQKIYSKDDAGAENATGQTSPTVGPILISAAPAYDLIHSFDYSPTQGLYNRDPGKRDVGHGLEMGYYTYMMIRVAATRKTGVEAITQPFSFKNEITAVHTDGTTPYPGFEFYVTECIPQPSGWGGEVWGKEGYYADQPLNTKVIDSGTCTFTRDDDSDPTSNYTFTIKDADLSGNRYPEKTVYGGMDLKAGPYYVINHRVQIWIPFRTIDAEDGIPGNNNGQPKVSSLLKGFDPNSGSGVSNFGAGTEPGFDGALMDNGQRSNNRLGPTDYPIFPAGNWCDYYYDRDTDTGANYTYLPTQSGWHAGDGEVEPGQTFHNKINYGNSGSVNLTNPVACMVFDNTTMKPVTRDKIGASADGTYAYVGTYPSEGFDYTKYVVEYGHTDFGTDDVLDGDHNGTKDYDIASGRYVGDWTKAAALRCDDAVSPAGWSTDINDTKFGGLDKVNMVRVRVIDPATTSLEPGQWIRFNLPLEARNTFNGGPYDGEQVPIGTVLASFGSVKSDQWAQTWTPGNPRSYKPMPETGSCDGDRVTLNRVSLRLDSESLTPVAASGKTASTLAGRQIVWKLNTSAQSRQSTAVANNVRIIDVLPPTATYNKACTTSQVGGTPPSLVEYNKDKDGNAAPGYTRLTWNLGDITANTEIAPRIFCTDTDSLAPNNTNVVNWATIRADNVSFSPSRQQDEHTITLEQSGSIQLSKKVDMPLDDMNDDQVYTISWSNFAPSFSINAPTVIDVLPFMSGGGDGMDSKSPRTPASNFHGKLTLTAKPTITWLDGTTPGAGDPNPELGTWYYTADAPETVDYNPDANTSKWCTEAQFGSGSGCPASLDKVTAIKFVSNYALERDGNPRQGMKSTFTLQAGDTVDPLSATANKPGDLYTNRFTMDSSSLPADQFLASNNVSVQVAAYSIGDFIFADNNQNGVYDAGVDAPAPDGVTVDLYDSADKKVISTTTAAGRFLFQPLASGKYYVKIPATQFQTGGKLYGWKIGIIPEGAKEDDNKNEAVDQHGYTTGSVTANGVRTGLLELSASIVDGVPTGNEPLGDNAGNITDPTGDDFSNLTLDIALIPPPSSLGDTVWNDVNQNGIQDVGEQGLSNVLVKLLDKNGNELKNVRTDAAGKYKFADLAAGTYFVEIVKPAAYLSSPKDQGTDDATDSDVDTVTGRTALITLGVGVDEVSVDAGLYKAASIGDRVWLDTNANGKQDASETTNLANVTVTLKDGAGVTLKTAQTDANGAYLFGGLSPGFYKVEVDTTDPDLAGYTLTTANNPVSVTLTEGQAYVDADFGFINFASVGDQVWDDLNGNGVQDAGEPGVAGVTVNLLDKNGANVLKTTTTDAAGQYLFSSLVPGDYIVAFVKPAGYAGFGASNVGGDDGKDSDADTTSGRTAVITLAGGAAPRDVDAGVYKAANLGDKLWFDADNDGVQDVGETGVAGVTVTLTGTRGDGTAVTASNTTTDAIGNYQFGNLYPGTYTVKFTLPAGMGFTAQDQGADDTLDSDVTAAGTVSATLASGGSNTTLDAGVRPATVSGRVWSDNNTHNSIDDDGAENGVVGVTVNLVDTKTGDVVATTTSGAGGAYTFTGVLPGTYQVQVLQPANMEFVLKDQGGNDAKDSDVDPANGKSQSFPVASGDAIVDVDAGIKPGSLGDRVWLDLNGNNLQDSGEPGVADVTVNLLDASNAVVATQTTDATGFYNFAAVLPGNYTVQFIAPTGMTFVGANQGTDDTVDSDPAGDGKVAVTVVSGVGNQTVDAGIAPAKLGDLVWLDANADGKQDANESPVVGMTVKLLDKNGNPVLDAGGNAVTAVTDGAGKYLFTVLPGEYRVGFDKPTGVVFTAQNQGAAATDSDVDPAMGMGAVVTLASGTENRDVDAGLMPALVSGAVIKDADADGVKDSGETGIAGVTVTLAGVDAFGQAVSLTATTDSNGAYRFNVLPGAYTLKETNPVDYLSSGSVAGSAAGAAVVSPDQLTTPALAGVASLNNDFLDYRTGSIAGQVRHDTDYNGSFADADAGIAGVTITLFTDPNGDGNPADGTAVGTATTNASGYYLFSDVKPGNYVVLETNLSAWESTADSQGANDERIPLVLASAQDSIGNDYLDAKQKGSLSGVVWTDTNTDGKRDAAEPTLGNVNVVVTDTNGAVVATLKTGADGAYKANNLPPGDYTVTVDVSTLPAGVLQTGDPDGLKDHQTTATVNAGAETSKLDFGYIGSAALGDVVWDDLNGNGVQDANEPGVAGVTVHLLDKTGDTILKTTTTDSTGKYGFDTLVPGDYKVEFKKPDAYGNFVAANVGTDDANDSDATELKTVAGVTTGRTAAIPLAGGATVLDVDAGLFKPASLGDVVWFDVNGDGMQQVGEPGVAGVTVTLGGTLGNGNPYPPQAAQTDANGKYQFTNLYPGSYEVVFTLPAGMAFTTQDQGTDLMDSDVAANGKVSVVLKSGETNTSVDAGVQPAAVSGRVWIDNNTENAKEDAAETGVVGVAVNLIDTKANTVVATTTTGADGAYHFTGVLPGSYQVQVLEPANMGFVAKDQGSDDAKDSDVTPTDGKSHTFSVVSGATITDVDAGIEPGALGDRVWLDSNGNHLQDSGEPGVAGVTVNLLDGAGAVVATQTTDATGFYNFAAVQPGEYTVKFVPPVGMAVVTADQGTDDALDSDPAADGEVKVTVVSGVGNQTVDAGIAPAHIGDYVWLDLNADGTQGAGEPAVAGVKVSLLDKSGAAVKDVGGNTVTTTTGADGKYHFTVLPGEYRIGFEKPALATFTLLQQGSNPAADSNADVASGITAAVIVASGDNHIDADAGLLPAQVSGYAIEDRNADGKLDVGETALVGVTITLSGNDVFGNPVTATTTTDNNGYYRFIVPAGTYTLTETTPAGYLSSGSQPGTAAGAVVVNVDAVTTPVTGGDKSENNNFFDYRLGSIAGQVRNDVNYNGVLADSEAGIGGVTLTLFTDPNGDGNPDDGVAVATTATHSDGTYLFKDIKPANYVVVETDLTQWDSTADTQGANDNRVAVVLASAQNSTGNDFLDAKQKGSLSGVVWTDANTDGVRDAGEPLLAQVTVNVLDAAGTLVTAAVTNDMGAYKAEGLPPGEYTVQVASSSIPVGTQQTGDPDALKDHQTAATVLPSQDTSGLDFGYVTLVAVGDKVWHDLNANGIQEADEPGLAGVMVALYRDANANGVAEATEQVKSSLTAADGTYGFADLLPLDYLVTFSLPEGYQRSPVQQGTDPAVDADANGDGIARASLKAGSRTDVDAGFYKLGNIGDYVWLDADEDGIQDANEPPIVGLEVQWLDKAGAVVATTTTDASGHYAFLNPKPGDYRVKFVLPAGLVTTKAGEGDDTAVDSDPDSSGAVAVTLASGQTISSVDAGILPAAVSGRVWIDRNANAQDDTESGVVGVSVKLVDVKTGETVATTTTGAEGQYHFSGVLPGEYRVEVVQPANMQFVAPDKGGDDTLDSDVKVTDGHSPPFILKSTDSVVDVDAGIEPGGLGDHVWLDQNNNGLQDAGEPGLAGITVKLLDTNGKEVATQTTDATGFYNFTGVLPGDYTVQFVLPETAQFTATDRGTDDELDSDVDAAGKVAVTVVSTIGNQSVDAGVKPALISGAVIDDRNADGVQDTDELAVVGVTVKLVGEDIFGNPVTLETVTDAKGTYRFIVPPGTYTLTETNPEGAVSTGSEAGTQGSTVKDKDTLEVTVASAQDSAQNDFLDFQPASISGQVRDDREGNGTLADLEQGIADVTVTLLQDGKEIATTKTDANGNYTFTGLKPGDYTVVETDLSAWVSTADVGDKNDNQVAVTVASGEDKLAQDFLDSGLGSLGDTVWLDSDNNAQQGSNEWVVSGITVNLSGTDRLGNGVALTTTTGAKGDYLFINLVPGVYNVEFVLPTGMRLVTANQGEDGAVDSDPDTGSRKANVTLLSGQHNKDVDAGIVPATLSGVAWEDNDGNAQHDVAEAVLPGVVVTLFSDPNGDGDWSDGVEVGKTTTNATGIYTFEGLLPAPYVVVVKPPATYVLVTPDQGADNSDSDFRATASVPVVLASGTTGNVDAGLYRVGSFGDRVWLDVNANGKQDEAELSVRDVTLVLLDAAGSPVVDPSNPVMPYRVVTDVNGVYTFTGLLPGKYQVQLEGVEGYVFTQTDAGTDDAVDSDSNANGRMLAVVASNGHNASVDAGILPASVTGRVWIDHNSQNGVDDSLYDEPGMVGVTVNLVGTDGKVVATTTTGAEGIYSFVGILPGDYQVQFAVPETLKLVPADAGEDDARDSDADPATGLTPVFTLTSSGVVKDLDAGIEPGGLGDRVWVDLNANGQQDAGEPGVAGIPVKLVNAKGKEIATATTDKDGFYAFTDVAPADYTVQFMVGDLKLTAALQGKDTAIDSDADPVTGKASVTAISGEPGNQTIDAGILPAKIGDTVWLDANRNGVQDAGEMALANVGILVLDTAGKPVATAQTDKDGKYQVAVPQGQYSVQVLAPDSTFTLANQGADDAVDSDIDGTGGSGIKLFTSGAHDTTLDAGVTPAIINGKVVDDVWADGKVDNGDAGIAGVTVTVVGVDSYGNPLSLTTTTDKDGNYQFILPPGTYTVTETQPAGYVSTGSTPANTAGSVVVDKEAVKVVLQSGVTAEGVNFLDYNPSTWIAVNGQVIDDHDHNMEAGVTERGLPKVRVTLFTDPNGDGDTRDGRPLETVVTDSSGTFTFGKVPPGNYVVVESDPANYDSTADSVGANDNRIPVTLVAGETPAKPVFLDAQPTGSLTGFVKLDADRDGDLTDAESGVAGITVELFTDPNGDGDPADGERVTSVQTDTDGHYVFDKVITGNYVLVATDKPAYISTADVAQANDNRIPVVVSVVDAVSHCDVAGGLASCTGLNFFDSALSSNIDLLKTAYQGHDAGAKCGTEVAKEKLTVVDIDKDKQEAVTYCFEISNTGENSLAAISLVDKTLALSADKLKPLGPVPLLLVPKSKDANARIRYYYEHTITKSLVNTAAVTAKPALEDGTVLGETVDANDESSVDVRFVFDPPSAFKTVTASGDYLMLWQMVWINSSSDQVAGVEVYDGVPEATHYAAMQAGAFVSADGVYCEARGSSKTAVCQYEAPSATYPRGRVIWKGEIGPDVGHTTEADAVNEVVIRFYSALDKVGEQQTISNQAHSSWDLDKDGKPEYDDMTTDNGGTDDPNDATDIALGSAAQIPTLGEWGLILLGLLMVWVAFGYQRRMRQW